jgi:hypothetical protein
MRKLLIICILMLFFGPLSSSIYAIQYCKDFLGSCNPGGWGTSVKSFDEEFGVGDYSNYEIDIWLNDVPTPLLTAGFWVEYDSTQIDIEDVLIYDSSDLPGPWNPEFSLKIPEPYGSGTYFVAVAGWLTPSYIPIIPDSDGDIIIARLQLYCSGAGVSGMRISTIPGFDTVVGEDSTVFDFQITPNVIGISQYA